MKRTFIIPLFGMFALSLACSTTDGQNVDEGNVDDAADDADDEGGSTFGDGIGGSEVGSGGGESESEGGGSEGGSTDGGPGGFIQEPDGGGVAMECDQWVQDCPENEKCMPWANDGGNAWNATRCSPVAENPGVVGDECTVEGSGVSGIDDCEVGTMCYYVDNETNMGSCVSMCFGSPDAPLCDPGFACSISNNGVLTLCRAECDPLLQDCVGDAACLPAAGADAFVCIVDASGEGGATGDACEFLNACDLGNFCADATGVPGCAAGGCCTEFCDLDDADPVAACSLAAQGVDCVPWFEEGEAPPDLTHVGACVLPA